jgi:hypothetical protein
MEGLDGGSQATFMLTQKMPEIACCQQADTFFTPESMSGRLLPGSSYATDFTRDLKKSIRKEQEEVLRMLSAL